MADMAWFNSLTAQGQANITGIYDDAVAHFLEGGVPEENIPDLAEWLATVDTADGELWAQGKESLRNDIKTMYTDHFEDDNGSTSENAGPASKKTDTSTTTTTTTGTGKTPPGTLGGRFGPNDDPGGMGGSFGTPDPNAKPKVITPPGDKTQNPGGGGGGGGATGGGGGSYGSGGGYGSSGSGAVAPSSNYPVLPMTELRRRMLQNMSAVYGRPMGGFPTPPGGWDPRMEAMFTTGAFEPQQASQEQIDAYNNRPKPSLPPLPSQKGSAMQNAPKPRSSQAPASTAGTVPPMPQGPSQQSIQQQMQASGLPMRPNQPLTPEQLAAMREELKKNGAILENWPRSAGPRMPNSMPTMPTTLAPGSPMKPPFIDPANQQLGARPGASALPTSYQDLLKKLQGM